MSDSMMLFGALLYIIFAVGCILFQVPVLALPALGFAAVIVGHFFCQELDRTR